MIEANDIRKTESIAPVLLHPIVTPPSNVEKLSSTIFGRVNIGRNECRCLKVSSATRMNTSRNRVKPLTKPRRSSIGRERNCSKSETRKVGLVKLCIGCNQAAV